MGRCQGFYCSAQVTALLATLAGRRAEEIMAMEQG
jgi:hypothetical protein